MRRRFIIGIKQSEIKMDRYVIATGTITHAIKGRDLLKSRGIKTHIERMKHSAEKYGCGYALSVVTNNISSVENLLKTNNVKVLNVSKI